MEDEITRSDGELFRRFVEKVIVQSMAEVAFLFKVGAEVREISKMPVGVEATSTGILP